MRRTAFFEKVSTATPLGDSEFRSDGIFRFSSWTEAIVIEGINSCDGGAVPGGTTTVAQESHSIIQSSQYIYIYRRHNHYLLLQPATAILRQSRKQTQPWTM